MFLYILTLTEKGVTKGVHSLMITMKNNISSGAAVEQVSLSYPSLYAVFTVDTLDTSHYSSCVPQTEDTAYKHWKLANEWCFCLPYFDVWEMVKFHSVDEVRIDKQSSLKKKFA